MTAGGGAAGITMTFAPDPAGVVLTTVGVEYAWCTVVTVTGWYSGWYELSHPSAARKRMRTMHRMAEGDYIERANRENATLSTRLRARRVTKSRQRVSHVRLRLSPNT